MSLDTFLQAIREREVRVLTRCRCARDRPVGELYMCLECVEVSCGLCAVAELDTFFCPADLESVPTGTAYGDRNRSQNTADCPLCFCALGTQQRGEREYGYVCEFCKWTSPFTAPTPAGLLETIQQRASEAGHAELFQRLCGAAIAQFKAEGREEDPANMDLGGARVRGAQDVLKAVEEIEADLERRSRPAHPLPSAPVDNSAAAPPPPEWFVAPALNVSRVSTLEQRTALPELQPLEAADLLPQNTRLMTKMAYRCPTCKKYTVKPTVSAKHVSFDRKRLAVEHLPSFSVSRAPAGTLVPTAASELVLYVENPTRSAVTVTLELVEADGDGDGDGDGNGDGDGDEAKDGRPTGSLAVRDEDAVGGGEWQVPSTGVVVDAFDETDEVLLPESKSSERLARPGDDEAGVVFRARNKTGVRITVTPPPPAVGRARATFCARVKAADRVAAEFDELRFLVTVDLGQADGAASE